MEINSLIVVYVRDLDKFQEMFDNDMTVGYLFKILQCSMLHVDVRECQILGLRPSIALANA